MFQLAACPDCGTLQLHRGLGEVEARACRACEETVPADGWEVREEHGSFEAARDRLRALRDPSGSRARSLSGDPPVPDALRPLEDVDPRRREALRALLEDLAARGDPVPEAVLVDALGTVGAAHLRNHLIREGYLEPVDPPSEDGEARYRVRREALAGEDG